MYVAVTGEDRVDLDGSVDTRAMKLEHHSRNGAWSIRLHGMHFNRSASIAVSPDLF